MKVSRVRLAVRPLSLVATYDIKELMFRDWATQRRCGTFLQRDRHSQPASHIVPRPEVSSALDV